MKVSIKYKEWAKQYLFEQLKNGHYFWSYDTSTMSVNDLSDEFLIEKVLLHLDLPELNLLFSVYPKKQIKEVWMWKLCALEPFHHWSNILFAKAYFDIKNVDKYIKTQSRRAVRANIGYGRNIPKN